MGSLQTRSLHRQQNLLESKQENKRNWFLFLSQFLAKQELDGSKQGLLSEPKTKKAKGCQKVGLEWGAVTI